MVNSAEDLRLNGLRCAEVVEAVVVLAARRVGLLLRLLGRPSPCGTGDDIPELGKMAQAVTRWAQEGEDAPLALLETGLATLEWLAALCADRNAPPGAPTFIDPVRDGAALVHRVQLVQLVIEAARARLDLQRDRAISQQALARLASRSEEFVFESMNAGALLPLKLFGDTAEVEPWVDIDPASARRWLRSLAVPGYFAETAARAS